MKNLTSLFLIVILVAGINSCRKDNYQDVCYGNDIQPILNRSCNNVGCHSGGPGSARDNFTSYNNTMKTVKAGHSNRSSLYTSIKGSHPDMPRDAQKLSALEVSKIKSWIDFGAKDCASTNTALTSCDTSNVTYAIHIKPLMDGFCNSCHFSGNLTGYTLDNYNGVAAAANSTKLLPSVKFTGDPMPQGGQKLSDCNIAKIEKWIQAGMPQ